MFRSIKSIVIPPANTGRETTKRNTAISTLHTNSVTFSREISGARKLVKETRKLIPPRIEDIPAKWSLKITISTDLLGWPRLLDKGG